MRVSVKWLICPARARLPPSSAHRGLWQAIYTYKATATSDASVTWSWGDGSPDTVGNTVQKVWNKPGSFTTTLSATAGGTTVSAKQGTVVAGEPISAGGDHTCALQPSGAVQCWGNNAYGQLGDGTAVSKTTSVAVLGLTDAVAISTGGIHTCALKSGGSVVCWGNNSNGQAGDGTPGSDKTSPVVVSGLTDAVALSAGRLHTCALRANSSVVCWGLNSNGQLGDGTTGNGSSSSNRLAPVAVIGLTDTVAISAGLFHTCALKTSGSAVCWGYNSQGQLGDGTVDNDKTSTVAVIGLADAVAISAGSYHTCALKSDSSVACWGSNVNGQLGNGTRVGQTTTVLVTGLTDAVALHSSKPAGEGSDGHTCALKATGGVVCWGDNFDGQLGDGTSGNIRTTTVAVSGLTNTAAVSAGDGHTCALGANGSVACWGNNGIGQIGDGTIGIFQNNLIAVTGLTDAAAVSASHTFHSCALKAGGSVVCWGTNSGGQLGDGTTITRTVTAVVVGLTDAVAVTAGEFNSCAIRAGGNVVCWGLNAFSVFGAGNTGSNQLVPVEIAGIANAVQVTIGNATICARTVSGSVFCWGLNSRFQAGVAVGTIQAVPVAVAGLADAVEISTGTSHTCARKAGGSVVCWGDNSTGQLGDGTTSTGAISAAVTGLTDAVEVSAGSGHTCARRAAGGVVCWGNNNNGQLGDGTTATSSVTVAVANLTDAVALSAGGQHSCARKASGSVVCWGRNDTGQLADGSFTDQATPVTVTGLTDAVQLSAGLQHTCAVRVGGSAICWGSNEFGQLGGNTVINTRDRLLPTAVVGGAIFWR